MSEIWLENGLAVPRMLGGSDMEYQVHLAALEYSLASAIIIRNRDDIKSVRHWSEHLEPFEHQIRNLITFCRRAPVAMIADEVGLGKTISAGLIISELMTRRRVSRTLVVCPKILMEQWQEELLAKFRINAVYESGRALLQHLRSDYPVVITTYHTARDRMEEIKKAGFSMVVLDEAHKLKSLHGQPKPAKLAHVMAEALDDRAFQFVLMLTATPIQNSAWDMYSLVDLLTKAQFHENPLGDPASFQREYLERIRGNRFQLKATSLSKFRHIISQYVMRAGRKSTNLPFPERIVSKRTASAQTGMAEAELLLVKALEGLNALQQVSLAEAMMSSNAAFAAQAGNMHVRGERFSSRNPGLLRQIRKMADAEPLGPKFEILRGLIGELQRKEEHFRLVVFTKRRATQEALVEAIGGMDIKVGTIAGGQFSDNVATIRKFWKDDPEVNVIVSTDAGAEGVNLQVCNFVVNYDLPWNPMVIEQRIGRVQRLGSTFEKVTVFNLTVRDSIEDRIVARLLEKFMTISSALGDIEPILSAANLDSEGETGMHEQLRQMVMDALKKKDVEADLARIESSIDKGKQLYEEEESFVNETLGNDLQKLHDAGPQIPELEPVEPRMSPEEFVRSAFVADGAKIMEQPDGSLLVKRSGDAVFTATFDSTDPRLRVVGAYGRQAGSNVRLYEPGAPAFEQLVGEWSARTVHATRMIGGALENSADQLLNAWFRQKCSGVEYLRHEITDRQAGYVGEAMVRASAGVAHDRIDRLIGVPLGEDLPAELLQQVRSGAQEQLHTMLHPDDLPDFRPATIRKTVEKDADLRKFVSFYEKRLKEELSRSEHPERQQMAKDNFTPRLSARIEGAQGFLVDTLQITVRYGIGDEFESSAQFTVAPGRIMAEPEVLSCVLSNVTAPEGAFSKCAVSGQVALKHLLRKSEKSGRRALPQQTGVCSVSDAVLLMDELGTCAVSGQLVDNALLDRCGATGQTVLPEHLGKCDFTWRNIRLDELIKSEISGKNLWQGDAVSCSISGLKGHPEELGQCEETQALVQESLLGCCSVSDSTVRADLLHVSELPPARKALARHMRRCEVSGMRILVTEGEESAASGRWVNSQLLMVSEGDAGLKALPDEFVTCEASGRRILHQETAICQDSQQRVHTELLQLNDVTQTEMLRSRMQLCPETDKWGRPDDFVTCSSSGQAVHPACLVQLNDGRNVIGRLTVGCSGCELPVLPTEAVPTAGGGLAHKECTAVCTWTGKRLLTRQAGICSRTDLVFDIEYLGESASLPLEHVLRACQMRWSRHQNPQLLTVLGNAGHKVHKVWAIDSPFTETIAIAALQSGLLGLRQTIWLGYISRDTKLLLKPLVKV